jgi:hypothetical protein
MRRKEEFPQLRHELMGAAGARRPNTAPVGCDPADDVDGPIPNTTKTLRKDYRPITTGKMIADRLSSVMAAGLPARRHSRSFKQDNCHGRSVHSSR